jgi:hypothetical protein
MQKEIEKKKKTVGIAFSDDSCSSQAVQNKALFMERQIKKSIAIKRLNFNSIPSHEMNAPI